MSDEVTIVGTLVAIIVLVILFVWVLSREDRARRAAGTRRISMVGYQTKLGWVMAIALAAITVFLLTRP